MNRTILHYNHPAAVIIGFLGMIAKLSDICFSCLAKFSSSFSHSPLKIILKQLFSSGSVNIAEHLLCLQRIIVKYRLVNRIFIGRKLSWHIRISRHYQGNKVRVSRVDEADRILEVDKHQPKVITFSCERCQCG